MRTLLTYLNLAGVLILAVLCSMQWKANRAANLELLSLRTAHRELTDKLAEQGRALQESSADLDRFREQLAESKAALKRDELKLKTAEREMAQLADERDQLKVSVTNWAAAVTERDDRFRVASEQAQSLVKERNEVVVKFNELAEKHNRTVMDLNSRTTEYQALVEKYNALAQREKQD